MVQFTLLRILLLSLTLLCYDSRADAPQAAPLFTQVTPAVGTAAAIAVVADIKHDYLAFVGKRDIRAIDHYSGAHARRDVIELLLLQQALLLGGFNHPIKLVEEENYFRSIRNVQEGRTLTTSGSIWLADLKLIQDIDITPALIPEGQFVVGLYTAESNKKARASRTLEALRKLRFVTSKQWKPDQKTLTQLGIKDIMYSPKWVNMARMVQAKRVDVTLAPFEQSPNMEISVEGIKLVPIQGLKVAIAGSRHWPVSQRHPMGKEFFSALTKGMAVLEARGTFARAYRECGFFHSGIGHWQLLNPPRKSAGRQAP
jgi:hypothetical protein